MPDMDGVAVAQHIATMDLQPMPKLLMVTASGRDEVRSLAQQAGIIDVLIKPYTPSLLFDATVSALRGEAPTEPAPAQVDHAQDLARIAGARILLVEDSPINQEVAFALLSDAGLEVTLADNGQQFYKIQT